MLQDLNTPQAAAQWLRTHVTGQLRTDSRQVQSGDGFLAWPGAAVDARKHVAGALAAGASACLVEHAGIESFAFDDARIAAMDGRHALRFWRQYKTALLALAAADGRGVAQQEAA